MKKLLILSLILGAFGASAAPPEGLPADTQLRGALWNAAATQAARQQWLAEREAAGLQRHSPYEWTLRAGVARRSDALGQRYAERELALERQLRIGAKPRLDTALAERGEAFAQTGWEMAWLDAGRGLLKSWFELAREEQRGESLGAQLALAARQVEVVRKRMAAGEAPRLELVQAEAEQQRLAAEAATAGLRAAAARADWRSRYPALAEARRPVLPANGADASPEPQESSMGAGLEARLLAASPELAAAREQLSLAQLRLHRLESDRLPDPTLGLRLAQERGGEERVLGLSLSMPFGGPQRDGRARVGAAEVAAAEARLHETELRLGGEARRLVLSLQGQADTRHRLARAAAHALDAATLAQRAYAAGETPLLGALQSQRQAFEARLAADHALIDLLETQGRVALELGELLQPTQLPDNALASLDLPTTANGARPR